MVNSYKDLRVWNEGIALAKLIYAITDSFPKTESYGLTSQLRRSAVSIPSNIAEGSKRGSTKELQQFLRIALGSLGELETQIIIAHGVRYIGNAALEELLAFMDKIGRMLVKLIQNLRTKVE